MALRHSLDRLVSHILMNTEQIRKKVQSLPYWTHPIIGLATVIILIATFPIWATLVAGQIVWEYTFGTNL